MEIGKKNYVQAAEQKMEQYERQARTPSNKSVSFSTRLMLWQPNYHALVRYNCHLVTGNVFDYLCLILPG